MTYVNNIDPLEPGNGDQVSQGAQEIRTLKAALIERLETVFTDIDADPLVVKTGLALVDPQIDDFTKAVIKNTGLAIRDSGDANTMVAVTDSGVALRNASFVGTVPSFFPPYSRTALTATATPGNGTTTDVLSLSLAAGTYLVTLSAAVNLSSSTGTDVAAMYLTDNSNAIILQTQHRRQPSIGEGLERYFQMYMSHLLVLGSAQTIKQRINLQADLVRSVKGTTEGFDTSITAIKVA